MDLGEHCQNAAALVATWPEWKRNVLGKYPKMKDDYADLLEFAWILIANVNNGDWSQQSEDWRESVYRFRDRYHAVIRNRLAQPQTSEPVIVNKGEP